MLNNSPSIQPESTRLLKTYSQLLRLRISFFLWLLVLVLWIALELFLAYSFITFGTSNLTWEIYASNIVILGGCIVFFCVRTILRTRSWKRFEQRRQAAIQGPQSLLASEQPEPDASALPLPSTITYHPSKAPFLRREGTILLALVIVSIFFLIDPLKPSTTTSDLGLAFLLLPLLVITIVFVGYCGYLFWTLYAREYKSILVTKDGLSVSGLLTRTPRFIAWQDARLLAIVSLFRSRYYQPSYQLEVSSANEIIYWSWPQAATRNIPYFNDPSSGTQEYEQQMNKLLSVITAKTGLSLYDLRQK